MNVLFSSINSVYRTVQQPPTDRKNLSGYLFAFSISKKAFPVGEGGRQRLTDEESVSFVSNTSSTANAVPLPLLGKAI